MRTLLEILAAIAVVAVIAVIAHAQWHCPNGKCNRPTLAPNEPVSIYRQIADDNTAQTMERAEPTAAPLAARTMETRPQSQPIPATTLPRIQTPTTNRHYIPVDHQPQRRGLFRRWRR